MNIAFISHLNNDAHREYAELIAKLLQKTLVCLPADTTADEQYAEQNDIDMLIFSCQNNKHKIRRVLLGCRDLRIPYLILTSSMTDLRTPQHILLPVSMLEEEVYKAQIAAHLARYANAEVLILTANDYGSRAMRNSQKIATHLRSMNIEPTLLTALRDSFHLYKETADRQRELHSDLIVWTASREYGLDDILFGPQELSLIMRSLKPVLLVNPREDLFSLCD